MERQPEHPLVPDFGGNYGYYVGAKYERLDVAEIAKRLRKEIKVAISSGKIPAVKCSVKISRFAGGRSLDIRVKEVPEGFAFLNPERVWLEKENPHDYSGHYHHPIYTDGGKELLACLEDMGNAYRYDRSDSQTDFFNTNFYFHVAFDGDLERATREKILADVRPVI